VTKGRGQQNMFEVKSRTLPVGGTTYKLILVFIFLNEWKKQKKSNISLHMKIVYNSVLCP
jgi:hypothetical protein